MALLQGSARAIWLLFPSFLCTHVFDFAMVCRISCLILIFYEEDNFLLFACSFYFPTNVIWVEFTKLDTISTPGKKYKFGLVIHQNGTDCTYCLHSPTRASLERRSSGLRSSLKVKRNLWRVFKVGHGTFSICMNDTIVGK